MVKAQHRQDLPVLMTGGESRFYRGGRIGCLVLHGFMASPNEVGWVASRLAGTGYTVFAPRLAGHAIDPTHMAWHRWQDWYASALDAYNILKQQCDKVAIVGHSMGGLLTMLVGGAVKADALVVAAAPLTSQSWMFTYSRLLAPVLRYTEHPTTPDLWQAVIAEQRRLGEPEVGRVHYRRWASHAVAELYDLLQTGLANLHHLTMPLCLIYARQDDTVRLTDRNIIAQSAPSHIIEQVTLEAGGHLIYMDAGREEAISATIDFIRRQVGPA